VAGRAPLDPKGRTAVVIDDGLATGASARAALHALRRRGAARLVLAVPVASAIGVLAGFAIEKYKDSPYYKSGKASAKKSA